MSFLTEKSPQAAASDQEFHSSWIPDQDSLRDPVENDSLILNPMTLFHNLVKAGTEKAVEKGKKYNPLYDPATDNLPIDEKIQQEIINTPQNDPTGVDPKDAEFLTTIMKLIEKGTINLHQPSSLLNQTIYDALTPDAQGKVDITAFNILSEIRQIHGLQKAGYTQTFQIQNLVRQVRLKKEGLEGVSGDVFIL
ncbi:hypothetical protein HZA41_03455 [Candidatus Peregrinibacteria bacterium]|nr:hypothetical protein [Candidatus Peregrinibacteria bacterium]